MSNGNDDKGRQPPPDDRTLLDPLSHEELKALREARQRMQAKKKTEPPSSAVKHHIVIGPEDTEQDTQPPQTPSAPPRRALPTFDGDVTLEKLSVSSAPTYADPPFEDQPTITPGQMRRSDVGSEREGPSTDPDNEPLDAPWAEDLAEPEHPGRTAEPSKPEATIIMSPAIGSNNPASPLDATAVAPPSEQPDRRGAHMIEPFEASSPPPADRPPDEELRAGQTGFGESTLMWMKPGKQRSVQPGSTVIGGAPKERPSNVKSLALGVAFLMVCLLGAVVLAWPPSTGVIELVTKPSGARLFIDGQVQEQNTPARLTLPVGQHTLRVEKEGFEPQTMAIEIQEGDGGRTDIDLVPVSEPGLMTVVIRVEPVNADVTLDGDVHAGVRTVHLPNIDPRSEHRIRVEAPGYLKTERIIPKGELQKSYRFELEPDVE
ncbi:MAG: PEGA domain-containing protein [Myxococcota bacterium]